MFHHPFPEELHELKRCVHASEQMSAEMRFGGK
jgi:hypothetical protein